ILNFLPSSLRALFSDSLLVRHFWELNFRKKVRIEIKGQEPLNGMGLVFFSKIVVSDYAQCK
ncbi:hypothetical protein, partial [Endozoicomonas sp. YOMI1]|uniref:hypothetical protein n=1 Tax=Endozoicomonas sp. YOMI1 TaxID=2828739 RepID=UPI0021473F88